jgi:hypothetical protein
MIRGRDLNLSMLRKPRQVGLMVMILRVRYYFGWGRVGSVSSSTPRRSILHCVLTLTTEGAKLTSAFE